MTPDDTPRTEAGLREALEEAISLELHGGAQMQQARWRKIATEYDRAAEAATPDAADVLDVERLRADIQAEIDLLPADPVGPFEAGAGAAYHWVLSRLAREDTQYR